MLQPDEIVCIRDMVKEIVESEIRNAFDREMSKTCVNSSSNKSDDAYFVDNISEKMTCWDILNWYRNLYYKEGKDTERGRMAWAIDDCFSQLNKIGYFNEHQTKITFMGNNKKANKRIS